MLAHELPLLLVEGTGLLEDRVGDRHLADVVELGGPGDGGDLDRREVHRLGDRDGNRRDGVSVGSEIGGPLLEDADQDGLDLAGG